MSLDDLRQRPYASPDAAGVYERIGFTATTRTVTYELSVERSAGV